MNPVQYGNPKVPNMKSRLHTQGCAAIPRHSDGYGCGLRLALSANPSISLFSSAFRLQYQQVTAGGGHATLHRQASARQKASNRNARKPRIVWCAESPGAAQVQVGQGKIGHDFC